MARKGEELICQRCGMTVNSNSARQKYCRDCSSLVQRERRKIENQKTRGTGFIVGEEMTCLLCGGSTIRLSTQQKVCPECRPEWQKMNRRRNNKRKAAELREAKIEKVKEVPLPKVGFTLSEVAAAARKHNMTYGQYVYQWKIGKVEPPEKMPQKKRGRKKRERSRILETTVCD